jgi:O-antigen/teichoic acid export membrane protein
VITKAKHLVNSTVVGGTIIVTIGAFIGSFFNYLTQVGLGRILSVEEYGTFNALLSLSVILSVPVLALTNSIIRNVSELKAMGRFDILTKMFVKSSYVSFCSRQF